MVRCHHCSAGAARDQRYCLACGERLPGAPGPVAARPAATQPALPVATASTAWPSHLPSPGAAAALVLCVLGFGVTAGAATGPPADAAVAAQPLRLALQLPAPTPVPTAAPTPRPAKRVVTAASAPVVAAAPPAAITSQAPVATPTPEPTPEATATPEATPTPDPPQPEAKHVFVIWLAGQGVDRTFADDSPATYLNGTLRRQGVLLQRYDGIAPGSLANGVALVAGRRPNADTSAECPEPLGPGCVFDDGTVSLADQLANAGLSARAYQEEPCDAPVPRNPFSYFRAECAPLAQLTTDVADADSAPALTFVAPAACDAGVTGACPPGEPDGLARQDAFLATVVPGIQASAAYADGGVLLVVFDRGVAEDPVTGAAAERAGALVVSPFAASGVASRKRYGPYALSRTLADIFGVEPLGRAADDGVRPFGTDVWPTP